MGGTASASEPMGPGVVVHHLSISSIDVDRTLQRFWELEEENPGPGGAAL